MRRMGFVLVVLLAGVFSSLITYCLTSRHVIGLTADVPDGTNQSISPAPIQYINCDYLILRDKSLMLIKPMLIAETSCESIELATLKKSLTEKIDELEKANTLTRASVYYKELNTSKWTEVNGFEKYYPGSMLKIAIMMNIFKQAELNPQLLERQLTIKENGSMNVIIQPAQKLGVGSSHSVLELLESMIINSDNDATKLLIELVDEKVYQRLFGDLDIPTPSMDDWFYTLTPSEFARLFRVLYNATFLNRNYSELAMQLLTKSAYKDGLLKYVPKETICAHKFGERFTDSSLKQFHETGIVYAGDRSFVVVIMTEGQKLDLLPEVVASLGSICYAFSNENQAGAH